jgi:hypothetical protein
MKPLSRRAMLRGAGAGIALPFLDAMTPAFARTRSRRATAPVRMAFLYVSNGVHMPAWRPGKEGALGELPRILQPLQKVKDDLIVFTGLAQDNARALGDGPGDHARALATFLTGVHPFKTAGANIKVGVSVDQVAAGKVGHLTRLPSLEIGIDRGAQSGSCDSGYSCAYSSNLSWKTESMPQAKETSPALVFDRLFGDGVDPKRDREKRSILDFVREDLESLEPKLGTTDRKKVDEYLTGVRELEQRIARFGELPPIEAPAFGRPEDAPKDFGEHVRLMSDLLVLAFQADITRIATFLWTNDASNRNYPTLDVPDGHHDISHHGHHPDKLEKIQRINVFHIQLLAYMLEKMKGIREGDRTLLDNCMLVYGSGISDGDKHNHDDLPILFAGRAGGAVRTGRHVVLPKTPLNNLFLAMLDRMNAPVEKLGDSTGKLDAWA